MAMTMTLRYVYMYIYMMIFVENEYYNNNMAYSSYMYAEFSQPLFIF